MPETTPAIGGVGVLDDLNKTVGSTFTKAGLLVYVIGETHGALGCSLYARDVLGIGTNAAPPSVDLERERVHGTFVRAQIAGGQAICAHDVSDGGLLCALAEMCLPHKIGCATDIEGDHGFWFGEDQGRYLVGLEPEAKAGFEKAAAEAGVHLTQIGATGGTELTIAGAMTISLVEIAKAHENWFPNLMGGR